MPRWSMLATGLVLVGLAAPVFAGNTVHPRTPVLWPDAPCIAAVDRTSDPMFEFGYSIPFEDTNLTIDEFDDSRTHQFIGFCRQWPAGTSPPQYISVDDLQRSIAAGAELDATKLEDPEATLETSVAWADCWTRITADDQRRPITFAAAAEPVVWDTSGVAPGTWVIAGYTWEPPYNLWRRAPWVVRVFDDDSDPALMQPALTIGSTPEVLVEDQEIDLDLCVAADPQATVRIAWATTEDAVPQWQEGEPTPIADLDPLSVAFAAPPEAWGLTLLLRARIENGLGSDYAAYPLTPIIVIKPSAGDSGESGGSDESSGSDGSTESADADTTDESETSDAGNQDAGSAGCQCAADSTRVPPLASLLALLGMIPLRRRKSIARTSRHVPT